MNPIPNNQYALPSTSSRTSRRPHYHPATNHSFITTSTTNQPSPHLLPSSDWDGTLSAALLRSFSYLRQALSSKQLHFNPPPLLSNILQLQPFRSSPNVPSPPTNSQIWFGMLCGLWYSSSALSSNTGKIILNQFKFPVTLTIIQFGFVAVWSGLFLVLRHHLHSFRLHNGLGYLNLRHGGIRVLIDFLGIRLPNPSTIRGTCIMSLFSIAGHVFSSMAISRVPVSTVHTIKALSPLFTVIAYAGLFGVRYGFNTYFSLLPLTLGVMLACSFDMRANGIGFLCALGSTVIFVSQNIFGKKLLPNSNHNNNSQSRPGSTHGRSLSSGSSGLVQLDKLYLLFYSSAIAFLMMVPIWMYADLSALLWIDDSNYQVPASRSAGAKGNITSNSISLTGYFIFNGTVHFAQCILAFSILSRTSPVTYSIASLFKRVAVICIAMVWFGQKVSIPQAFGMVLTFLGLYIYNQSKSEIDQGEKRRGILERKNDLLLSLPSTSTDLKNLEESDSILHHHSVNEKPYHNNQNSAARLENPFRRESLLATSVQLSPTCHHLQQIPSAEQANSSGRGADRTSMITRQRAPSIPASSFSATPTSNSLQSNNSIQPPPFYTSHHHPQQPHSPLSNHPFSHSNKSPTLKPLQETNSFRSIVNVR